MKISILTEGGKNCGFGHITRCVALSDAGTKMGIQTELVINGDKSVLGLLKGKCYRIFNWTLGKEALFSAAKGANAIIVDSYLAKRTLYDKLAESFDGKMLMIDDFGRMDYPGGIVLNPSIAPERIHYPQNDGIKYLRGKDYIILRKEFWNVPQKHIRRKIGDVLITAGGAEHNGLIHKMAVYLKKTFFFNLHINLPQKKVLPANKMRELMLNVDLCISGGGQTTNELARVGVPTIGICFADNQIFNLLGWQEKGFIENIGAHADRNLLTRLNAAIIKLTPYEERFRRSAIGRQNVDGKGAQRIMEALMD